MQSTATKPKIIRVKIERGTAGLFYATSPNLAGLLVAEDTMEKLEVAIPAAIRDLYAACDVQVFVTRAEDGEEGLGPLIAFPAEIARQALQNTKVPATISPSFVAAWPIKVDMLGGGGAPKPGTRIPSRKVSNSLIAWSIWSRFARRSEITASYGFGWSFIGSGPV